MHIVHGVLEYDDYFRLKKGCTYMIGFSSFQKCIAVLRCLAYAVVADTQDDYLRMVESTCSKTMYMFCKVVLLEEKLLFTTLDFRGRKAIFVVKSFLPRLGYRGRIRVAKRSTTDG